MDVDSEREASGGETVEHLVSLLAPCIFEENPSSNSASVERVLAAPALATGLLTFCERLKAERQRIQSLPLDAPRKEVLLQAIRSELRSYVQSLIEFRGKTKTSS